MVKKILKNLMQKPKPIQTHKEKPQTKKKKYAPKYPDETDNQIDAISKKIQSIALTDESQTQVTPLTPPTKSITKRKTLRKTPEKQPKKSLKKQTNPIKDEITLAEYKKFLTTLCPLHSAIYHKKTLKEQSITIEWYKKLKNIWKSDKQDKTESFKAISKPGKETVIKKTQKIMDVQNITVEFMKRLKPRHWLNDEVINSYIELMEIDMLRNNLQVKKDDLRICLVKTYFAALKMAPQRIQREIKKRALSYKTLLIIPINEDYHWFFLMIFDHKMYVFDSILPNTLKSDKQINLCKKLYSMKDSVRKCVKLYEKMYKVQEMDMNQVVIVSEFPQQDNQNDCGMMMLCGIKNVISRFQSVKREEEMKKFGQVIEGKEFWTFCIQDIRYLRFMFGRQLLEESLII